jgi:hypothetical protein
MTELADQLSNEAANGGVAPAEISSADGPEGVNGATRASSEAAEKPLSLRDQLNKSIETVRTEEAKRARDVTTGKFAKTETAAEKPAPAEKSQTPTTEQTAQHDASKPDAAPSAWKGVWEVLTPEARAIAVKREADVEKGFTEYRNKTAQLQEISQALEPLRPILQQNGIQSDAQAVKTLLNWEQGFRNPQTRIQSFHSLAKQYGVDLSTLAQGSSQPAQDIPEPLRPVIDQFGNIVQEMNGLKAEFQRSREEKVSQELTSFAKDKPHFEKVRVSMGQLMQAGMADSLESAYQKALAIDPEIAAQVKAEEDKKRTEELAKAQAEKANKARLAAVSPGSRSPTAPLNGSAKPGGTKVRDSILASVAALRDEQRA